MEYRTGNQGKIIVAKFDDGDDILSGISDIVKKEEIRCAFFTLVGGMKGGSFVVGPQDETMPPKPMWRDLKESHEIFGNGTIFWEGDTPKIHFHGSYSKGDSVRAGCLRKDSQAFLITEAVIVEIQGIDAKRELDEKVGLPLLKFY